MRMMIGLLLALAVIACGTEEPVDRDERRERPERSERPERAVTLPAVAAVATAPAPEAVTLPDIEGSVPSGLNPADDPGVATIESDPVSPTVAATVAPLPTGTLIPALTATPEVTEIPTPEPVHDVVRMTCTIDYRRWLVEEDWFDARDLHNRLPEFEELRPDCVGDKFAPEFSSLAVCQHKNRVGGHTVSSMFTIDPTVSSRGLAETGKDLSGILIHFLRLPNVDAPGCWYYDTYHDEWVVSVVDEQGRRLIPTPEATVAAATAFAMCDEELRWRLLADMEPIAAGSMQVLADRVARGFGSCNLGWGPVVSPERLHPDCPVTPSGRDSMGNLVVHWNLPPDDGSACWMYDIRSDHWDTVQDTP